MKLILVAVVLLAASHSALGKKWGFCELARLLCNKHQFSESELPDWMCLIEHESTFDQAAINKSNSDGSWDWGLFQINDNYWCRGNRQGKSNGCNVDCTVFTNGDKDLKQTVACARTVFRAHKFDGWMAWKAHCKGKNLSAYKNKVRTCF